MEPLFSSLAKVIAGLGPDHVGRRAIVFAAWRKAAGQAIAARTEPVELDGIRLIVNVADEAWVSHLKALAPEMLAKINALVGQGTVTLIDFRSTEAST